MTRIEETGKDDFSTLLDVAWEGIELASALLYLGNGEETEYVKKWMLSPVEDVTKRIAALILECFRSVVNFANQQRE